MSETTYTEHTSFRMNKKVKEKLIEVAKKHGMTLAKLLNTILFNSKEYRE